MPSLRRTLIQLLTEMEFSGVGRNKEQSARMLGHLVSNAPALIRPYVEPILKARSNEMMLFIIFCFILSLDSRS